MTLAEQLELILIDTDCSSVRPWAEEAVLRLLTQGNWQVVNVCCFKLLSLWPFVLE